MGEGGEEEKDEVERMEYREARVEQKVAIPTQDPSFADASLKLSA